MVSPVSTAGVECRLERPRLAGDGIQTVKSSMETLAIYLRRNMKERI